jgi:GT2 family glycosyltransferase
VNPCLILTHNSLELTKCTIASVLAQDIETTPYVVDNASTDGTVEWLRDRSIRHWHRSANGVSSGWNFGLDYLFNTAQCEYVFVANNDTEFRPDTYRTLIADGGPFVTCVSVGDKEQLEWDGVIRKRPHPDFSAYLIRREVWNKICKFDESMIYYASDADFHLRMHRSGIEAVTLGIPFFHYASGTLKNATAEERQQIEKQADLDRETFQRKWGVKVGSKQYYDLFGHGRPDDIT